MPAPTPAVRSRSSQVCSAETARAKHTPPINGVAAVSSHTGVVAGPDGTAPSIGKAGSVPCTVEPSLTPLPEPTANPGPARYDAPAIAAFGAASAPSSRIGTP